MTFSSLTICFAQNPNFLKKYSYFCFTKPVKSDVHIGTCFFYKNGADVYVVTNYHVMRGMDPILRRKTFESDTLIIVYPVNGSNNNKFSILDLRNEKVSVFYHYDRIDLECHLIKTPLNIKINFINDLIDKNYLKVKPTKLFVYGYPADLQPTNILNEKPVVAEVTGKYHNYYKSYQLAYATKTIQKSVKQKEFEMDGFVRKGFSGSPVFGQFSQNGKYVYKLMGVVFASSKETKTSNCINLSTIYDFLPH